MKNHKGLLFFVALTICIGLALRTEMLSRSQAASALLRFEAATIKATDKGVPPSPLRQRSCRGSDSRSQAVNTPFGAIAPGPLGRCILESMNLGFLIRFAYDLAGPLYDADAIFTGGPSWLKSDLFDVNAEAENPTTTTEAQLKQMLQTLLADRFKLKFHHQANAQADGYSLIVGKDGPKIHPGTSPQGGATAPASPNGSYTSRNQPLKGLVLILSKLFNRPIVDQTGLTESYSFTLSWTPGENEQPLVRLIPELEARFPKPDPNGPSIFTALQEQLGLRLVAQKVPVDIVVIDHAEKPAEN